MHSSAQAELDTLLDERNSASDAEARAAVDGRIRDRFTRTRAVLISDMSGFSRITQAEGILHFLAMVRRMRGEVTGMVAAAGGRLVKTEADNMYLVFDHPEHALTAAIAMLAFCRTEGSRPENEAIGLSLGLGWGEVLDLDGEDYFGDQVNLASKLGEDIANRGECLATESFVDGLGEHSGWFWERHETRISRIALPYFSLHRVR